MFEVERGSRKMSEGWILIGKSFCFTICSKIYGWVDCSMSLSFGIFKAFLMKPGLSLVLRIEFWVFTNGHHRLSRALLFATWGFKLISFPEITRIYGQLSCRSQRVEADIESILLLLNVISGNLQRSRNGDVNTNISSPIFILSQEKIVQNNM